MCKAYVLALGVLVIGFFSYFLQMGLAMRPEIVDHRQDWETFNRDEVMDLFSIPTEAKILSAQATYDLMGYGWEVVFSLPPTRTVPAWMGLIVEGKDIAEHRVLPDYYDASGEGYDLYLAKYDPGSRVYRVKWAWD